MVLRATLALLLGVGCVQPAPVVRAADSTAAALLLVLDQEHASGVTEVPPVLAERVAAQLESRNLVPELVPAEGYAAAFAVVRDTERRVARLLEAQKAPLAVLVETKAVYYSPMNGRYRWTVHARLTAARTDGSRAPVTREIDLSSFVDFEHEREAAALTAASGAIAERAGALLDELLSDVEH